MKNILAAILINFIGFTLTAQTVNSNLFEETNNFFAENIANGKVDYGKINQSSIQSLTDKYANVSIDGLKLNEQKAFLINAYNLNVIKEVSKVYPISSVLLSPSFFDKKNVNILGQQMSLNELEKSYILKQFDDPRLHFVLVCAAVDCPKVVPYAFTPENIEEQLSERTTKSLDDPSFLRPTKEGIALSQIFKWYIDDFGGSEKKAVAYINDYKTEPIKNGTAISYYTYDWTLNDTNGSSVGNNSNRYVVSAAIPKKSIELKLFNNLYSESAKKNFDGFRSSFFTTTVTGLYGVSNRLNLGVIGKYRRVKITDNASPLLNVLSNVEPLGRTGITGIGPLFRYAPTSALPNFSIQGSYFIPIGNDLQGNATEPFIDWDHSILQIQLFNDIPIGTNFSIFTELDLLIEDIGDSGRISTPATLILSYFPIKNLTVYGLGSYSPFYEKPYDYFYQFGVGSKYQFTPKFELELLYTRFVNRRIAESESTLAQTVNLGTRFNF